MPPPVSAYDNGAQGNGPPAPSKQAAPAPAPERQAGDRQGDGTESAASAAEEQEGGASQPAARPEPDLLTGFPWRHHDSNSWRLLPQRRHGCHRPFHLLQVASWFLYTFFLAMGVVVVAPALHLGVRVCLYAAFAIAYVVMIWSCYMAMYTDAGDLGLVHKGLNLYAHSGVPTARCSTCDAWIRRDSKHCKACNKCIADFDHHCKWLNNCIGASNYAYFYTFLVDTLGISAVLLIVCIYLLADSYSRPGYYEDELRNSHLSAMDLPNYRAAVGCTGGLNLIALGLLAQLTHFHAYRLYRRGLTTYEWIMAGRMGEVLDMAARLAHRKEQEMQETEEAAQAAQQQPESGTPGGPLQPPPSVPAAPRDSAQEAPSVLPPQAVPPHPQPQAAEPGPPPQVAPPGRPPQAAAPSPQEQQSPATPPPAGEPPAAPAQLEQPAPGAGPSSPPLPPLPHPDAAGQGHTGSAPQPSEGGEASQSPGGGESKQGRPKKRKKPKGRGTARSPSSLSTESAGGQSPEGQPA
eukprot:TRINITY_DN26024_c0_g1_i1.p1 TRINITY_DN26024_c0_g1~~TRINITY_DN26024_c0_g1_i1.p1  ORF type:complete len:552 (+),score=111.40 TRINITY_DN26024_c0_g1_i1:97-1656(+)